MAIIYRDYGAMGNSMTPNNAVNIEPRRQVYQATHKGDGSRLPYMNRSFISFTFGDKLIEDFNLIATIVNNRMDKEGYASFNDITTSYDTLDGQYYWSTHYKTNSITFVLATDGMNQQTLDDFLYWFRAGDTKELVLSEHPNRAIMARVATPPQLSLLPFEEKIEVMISNIKYPTSTTLYKGEITLELIMDSPFWYAKQNILGKTEEVEIDGQTKIRYVDEWDDISRPIEDQAVSIFSSKDALKIILEDGIPLAGMINSNMILGNKAYANVERNPNSETWSIANDEDITWDAQGNPSGTGARIYGTLSQAEIDQNATNHAQNPTKYPLIKWPKGNYYGVTAGAIINANGDGIDQLASGEYGYFYYAGTAPAPTIITFSLTPVFKQNDYYIAVPFNSYCPNPITDEPYNIFTIQSKNKQEFKFTTPNLYTSYNDAINLIKTYVNPNSVKTWEDMRQAIRENIHHIHVRQYLNNLIKQYDSSEENIRNSSYASELCNSMKNFLMNGNEGPALATFTFNSETGAAIGIFGYKTIVDGAEVFTQATEDVGDMLRSNYIVIRERNYPDKKLGVVTAWQNNNDETRSYSHCISHNLPSGSPLYSIQIEYRNMYL